MQEEGLALRRQRCLWTSATWSATGPTTMVPDPRPCLPLRRRSLRDRNRNDLWFSSGMPVKKPACTAHVTTPIFRSFPTIGSRHSSTWIWSDAMIATTSRATTRNTLFIVGADRISTDLHNLVIQTNGTLSQPLTLDYELNDANDPENVYTRSDHFSYAAKGIPIVFFTTGLHPDYHRITDTVDKIKFPKMTRIAQLVYEVGFSIANSEKTLERDNKGPRTGFASKAEVLAK